MPSYTHDNHFSYVLVKCNITPECFVWLQKIVYCTKITYIIFQLSYNFVSNKAFLACDCLTEFAFSDPVLNVVRCRLSRIGPFKQQCPTKTSQSFHRGRAKQELHALQEDFPVARIYAHTYAYAHRSVCLCIVVTYNYLHIIYL